MRAIIKETLIWAKNKGKSIRVVKRYLKLKHNISITLDALLKRINH
tara:strand:- start:805 stop:942 length:138 start_codon:yes stop_codon:yes gene_type:complete